MLLGSIETAVLLVSSTLIALAVRALKLNERRRQAVAFLCGTAALGVSFLLMHAVEYDKECTEHLIPGIDFAQSGPQAYAVELFFCLYYPCTFSSGSP